MRKQKPFPDEMVLQVQQMQAEGYLDREIQEYLVRSGTLTEWDAEVLLHELNGEKGEKPLMRRNWLIISGFNAIGLPLVFFTAKFIYEDNTLIGNAWYRLAAIIISMVLFIAGCVFIQQGISELISGTKPR